VVRSSSKGKGESQLVAGPLLLLLILYEAALVTRAAEQ